MTKYSNLNENAIREAAYFIWKNNGCPANTSINDWNLAIQQLSNAGFYNINNNTKNKVSLKASSCSNNSVKKCSKSTTSLNKKSSSNSKKSK